MTLELITFGLVFHSALYYLSRAYFAKWLCRMLLRSRTQANNVTEGQLAEIAQLIVGVVFASIASVFSVIILYQSKDDVINQRSWVLAPFAHFGAWYYLIDCYTMYRAYRLRGHTPSSLGGSVCSFIKRKWSILGHHFLLLFVGYPLAVNYSVRGGRGDFVVGALIAEEWSTPFLSTVKILRLLGLTNSYLYRLTGLALLSTFFLVRVANLPLVILLYAAQHHNWSVTSALSSMTPVCHFFNALQLALQTYWYLSLLKIAAASHYKRTSVGHHKPN